MTYIIVDLANTFFRSRHAIKGDADTKIGMALHITLNSIRKVWQDFNGSHVIFCLEGKSWRKGVYAPYKKNRADARAALTVKEQEEETLFWETFDIFKQFVIEKTNCSVLHNPQLEADDLIAGVIQAHPDKNHIIVSTDSDFVQLIAPNVKQYNGVTDQLVTHEGVYDAKGRKLSFTIGSNSKLKIGKADPSFVPPPNWTEFALFLKCIRGDSGDHVFSAYPKVRIQSSKNKIGLQEAFDDRATKGWAWNNLMLQRWSDHLGKEHRVLEDYERNRMLIDLTCQPDEIKDIIKDTIATQLVEKNVNQVGIRLLKFCQLYNLQKVADQAHSYAEPLNARYF